MSSNIRAEKPELATSMKVQLNKLLGSVKAKMSIENPSKDITEEIAH
jgi:hypothetical protein